MGRLLSLGDVQLVEHKSELMSINITNFKFCLFLYCAVVVW